MKIKGCYLRKHFSLAPIVFYLFTFAPALAPANIFDDSYFRGRAVLDAFDVPISFAADLKLFSHHYEKIQGDRWAYFLGKFDEGYDFIGVLKDMLRKEGVPQELIYLAMAESEFSPRAYSPKKASGIWQIMPETAKHLGLKIDGFIDERRDPIKSTKAAIAYLKFLHGATSKWYLAAIAYNCGIGRLQKAIKKAGTDDIAVLLDEEKKYLPKETRNYMRTILSMGIAFGDINNLSFNEKEHFLNRAGISTLVSVKVGPATSLEGIAKASEIPYEMLKRYNRHLKYPFTPPTAGKSYAIYMPYENLLPFKTNFKQEKNQHSKQFFIIYHVRAGDTLYGISRRYNISINALKAFNEIKGNHLSIKDKLVLPLFKGANTFAQK